jgi:hypothetical protein
MLPNANAMKIYFLHSNQQFLGPFSLDEVRGKSITKEDLIWKDGTEDWVPAATLEEFACMFNSSPLLTGVVNEYHSRKSNSFFGRFLGR